MSETFAGLPAPAIPAPRAATVVILWREGPHGVEVFVVRRGQPLRFAGGFQAFPGGKIDSDDRAVTVANLPPSRQAQDPPAPAERAAQITGAVRELFEETGVLIARGAEAVAIPERQRARRALLDGTQAFSSFVEEQQLTLDASRLAPAGRWITPPFGPMRFDTQFFLAALPAGESPEIWPGELSEGAFVACEQLLGRWRTGQALLHPPTRWALEVLAQRSPSQAVDLLQNPPHCRGFVVQRIDFQQGLWVVPLRTPTLPPATHTNCYLVDVGRALAIVDPGASDQIEQQRLESQVDALSAEGYPARAIWLTHHHGDHVGGVVRLAQRYQLPVVCHTRTADRLPGGLDVQSAGEGTLLPGGWRALYTPGHARGHLSFLHGQSGALLCGDMASTLSTIVIDPPEGDMAVYMQQLQRLRDLGPRTLYPAHGPPDPDAAAKLEQTLAHRVSREAKVTAAIGPGGTLGAITARAYDDTAPALFPVAERSCLASLEKLIAEGHVVRQGDQYFPGRSRP